MREGGVEKGGKGTSIERDGIGKFLKYRNPWNALVLRICTRELPFPVPLFVASIFVQSPPSPPLHDQISRVTRVRAGFEVVQPDTTSSTRACYLFDLKCDTFSSFARTRRLARVFESGIRPQTTWNYFIDACLLLPTALSIETRYSKNTFYNSR